VKIADLSNPLVDLAGLLFIGVLLLGQIRTRRVAVRRLWLIPLIVIILTGVVVALKPPADLSGWGWFGLALVIGLAVGFTRGAFTDVQHVDPRGGVMLMRSTDMGILLWLAVWAVRIVIRQMVGQSEPDASTASLVTQILLIFAVGTVVSNAVFTYRAYVSAKRSVAW
jgi:Protein of unknown function (DUF1453)